MARLLLILALVLSPAALGSAMVGWPACRAAEAAASATCHDASQVMCCCCGSDEAPATSPQCPCIEAPQAPAPPSAPLPSAPTVVSLPHLALIGVVNASELPASFRSASWRQALRSPARSAQQARATLCIWLT